MNIIKKHYYLMQAGNGKLPQNEFRNFCVRYSEYSSYSSKDILEKYFSKYEPNHGELEQIYQSISVTELYLKSSANRKFSKTEQHYMLDHCVIKDIVCSYLDEDVIMSVINRSFKENRYRRILEKYLDKEQLSPICVHYAKYILTCMKTEKCNEEVTLYANNMISKIGHNLSFSGVIEGCATFQRIKEQVPKYAEQVYSSSLTDCMISETELSLLIEEQNSDVISSILYRSYIPYTHIKQELLSNPQLNKEGMNVMLMISEIRRNMNIKRQKGCKNLYLSLTEDEFRAILQHQQNNKGIGRVPHLMSLIKRSDVSLEYLAWIAYEFPELRTDVMLRIPAVVCR